MKTVHTLEYFHWSAITASDSKHLHILNTSFLMEESCRLLMKMTEDVSLSGEFIRKRSLTSCESYVMLFIAIVTGKRGRETKLVLMIIFTLENILLSL